MTKNNQKSDGLVLSSARGRNGLNGSKACCDSSWRSVIGKMHPGQVTESHISLTCKSLDCGRKPDNADSSHKGPPQPVDSKS